MGIDFGMEVVQIGPGGEVIFQDVDDMDDKSHFAQRYHILEVILAKGIFGERIKSFDLRGKSQLECFEAVMIPGPGYALSHGLMIFISKG